MLKNELDIKRPVNVSKFKIDINYKNIIFAKYKLELHKYCKAILGNKNINDLIDLNALIYSQFNKTVKTYGKLKYKISFRRLLFNNCKFQLLTELVKIQKKYNGYCKAIGKIKNDGENHYIDYNTPETFFKDINENEDFYLFLKKYKKKRTVKIINMLIQGKTSKHIAKKLNIPKHTYYNDVRTFIKKAKDCLVSEL